MHQAEPLEPFLKAVLQETWETFKKDALTFVFAGALVFVVSIVSLGILLGPLVVGFFDVLRRVRAGETAAASDVFSGLQHFGASFVAVILMTLAISLGCMMLVVPGLLAALFSAYVFPAIAYENLGAVAAIKRSVEIVRAHFLNTLIFALLISLVQSLGAGTMLGALLTLPLGLMALGIAFERTRGTVQLTTTPYTSVV